MRNTKPVLSQGSRKLLEELANEAPNWSGSPLLPDLKKKEEGYLTDLKKKGLITTDIDEGCVWVYFTQCGEAYVQSEFNINIEA